MRSASLLALAFGGMLLAAPALAADPAPRSSSSQENANNKRRSVYVVIQKGSNRQMVRIDFDDYESPDTARANKLSRPSQDR